MSDYMKRVARWLKKSTTENKELSRKLHKIVIDDECAYSTNGYMLFAHKNIDTPDEQIETAHKLGIEFEYKSNDYPNVKEIVRNTEGRHVEYEMFVPRKMLIDALYGMNDSDIVKLSFRKPNRPFTVSNGSAYALIMPMLEEISTYTPFISDYK